MSNPDPSNSVGLLIPNGSTGFPLQVGGDNPLPVALTTGTGADSMQVQGAAADGAAAAGNPVLVGGMGPSSLAQTILVDATGAVTVVNTLGATVAAQTAVQATVGAVVANRSVIYDSSGVAVDYSSAVPVYPGTSPNPAYSASVTGLALAAAATDIFTLTGSASKTVRITRIQVSGIATAASAVDLVLVKRSTADTGGTATNPTVVPNDSADAAGTAVVAAYTANPTTGALVGPVRSRKVTLTTAAGGLTSVTTIFDSGQQSGKPITLRGVAQQLALNFNGATVAGATLNIDIEWYEE